MNNTISLLDVNTIELHYWLNDDSHLMDAHVFNKCEYEFFGYYSRSIFIFTYPG